MGALIFFFDFGASVVVVGDASVVDCVDFPVHVVTSSHSAVTGVTTSDLPVHSVASSQGGRYGVAASDSPVHFASGSVGLP